MICVELEGNQHWLSPVEFEEITGVKFISSLEMENDSVCQKVHRLGEKLEKKRKLSTSKIRRFFAQFSSAVSLVKKELRIEQFWRGQYYYKEIVSPSFSSVFLRKINPSIGWGVFAARCLKPREYIAEYTGVIRKRRRSDHYNAYCFEYMAEPGRLTSFIIDAKERSGIARYINHSEKPNLEPMLATIGLQTHLILLTTRAIQVGEQLCYDYGPAYWKKRSPPVTL